MGGWLRDKLVELGLNVIVLGLFLSVQFNWSPVWVERPGAALAWLLGYGVWLFVPVSFFGCPEEAIWRGRPAGGQEFLG